VLNALYLLTFTRKLALKALTLSAAEVESAEVQLPLGFTQAQRMLRYLAVHPNASTAEVAANCAIGNLSDVARKSNRYLAIQNLFISCRRPARRLANRFGEPSRMFQWGIYRIDELGADVEN